MNSDTNVVWLEFLNFMGETQDDVPNASCLTRKERGEWQSFLAGWVSRHVHKDDNTLSPDTVDEIKAWTREFVQMMMDAHRTISHKEENREEDSIQKVTKHPPYNVG